MSVYGLEGWVEDLPSLNTGRSYHACSSYISGGTRVSYISGGTRISVVGKCKCKGWWTRYTALLAMHYYIIIQVFLVTGGTNDIGDNLNSTEVYDPRVGSWATGAKLLRPMYGFRATNIDGRVLFFGKDIYS